MDLTKREYFAAKAMQGLLANPVAGDPTLHETPNEWVKDISGASVEFADAIIAELKRTDTDNQGG